MTEATPPNVDPKAMAKSANPDATSASQKEMERINKLVYEQGMSPEAAIKKISGEPAAKKRPKNLPRVEVTGPISGVEVPREGMAVGGRRLRPVRIARLLQGMSRPAKYLLLKYLAAHPGNKRRGKALRKHGMDWCRKELAKMDCGCGCKGMKKLRQLTGGVLKDCPPGYRNDGLTCLEECQGNEIDTGLACLGPRDCPGDYPRDDGTACWRDLKCEGGDVVAKGSRYNPIYWDSCCSRGWFNECYGCARGGDVVLESCPPGTVDDGLLCRYPITCNDGPKNFYKSSRTKQIVGRVDWNATMEEIGKGIEEAFSADGALARAFDPEKNGVAQAFREFGENTKEAFAKVGDELFKAFDPAQNGVGAAFEKLGEAMANTIGNADWWKETMTDPDTYIMLIGAIASAAATVLSAGTLGPVAFAALNMLGPSLKMIGDLAQGRPVDGLDIAAIAFAMIPMPGASAAANQLSNSIIEGAKYGVMASKALPYVQKAVKVGEIVVEGVKIAQGLGLVDKTCLANCPPPPPVVDFSPEDKDALDKELAGLFGEEGPGSLGDALDNIDLGDIDLGDDLGNIDLGGLGDIDTGAMDLGGIDLGESMIPEDVPQDARPADPTLPSDPPPTNPGPLKVAFQEKYGIPATELNAQVNLEGYANYAPLEPLAAQAGQPGNIDMVFEEMTAAVNEPLVGGRSRTSRRGVMSYQSAFDARRASVHRKKEELVQRRAMVIQTRNKIKPVAMRPDLLNAPSRSMRGRGTPLAQGGEVLEFYYPATNVREARGVTSSTEVPGGFAAGLAGTGRPEMYF
jgi:hypothetical protein